MHDVDDVRIPVWTFVGELEGAYLAIRPIWPIFPHTILPGREAIEPLLKRDQFSFRFFQALPARQLSIIPEFVHRQMVHVRVISKLPE